MNALVRHADLFFTRLGAWLTRHWVLVTLILWLAMCIWMVSDLWLRIKFFGLPDTDDNLRMAQVRALLAGQDWYDLHQYRMNWPNGLNVHWSRLVDLPIAGLILALKPFLGPVMAERWAVAIAPMIPLGVLLMTLSVITRRMIGRAAYPLAAIIFATTMMSLSMFQPLRIDHHGWQITCLALLVWGLVDRNRLRGGMVVGAATAGSLIIGLEMLPYLALGGAAIVLRWVTDRSEEKALIGYALSLAFGTVIGILFFISYDNRGPVCDALSPVWYSTTLLTSGILAAFGFARVEGWQWRLILAVAAALALASFFAGSWPNCLGRPENVPDELNRLWLSNVREAKPIFAQSWKVQLTTLVIPVIGVIGLFIELWANRNDRSRFVPWATIALIPLASLALLFWQTRAGPAAQMLGVIGCVALAWRLRKYKVVMVAIVLSAMLIQAFVDYVPDKPKTPQFMVQILDHLGWGDGFKPAKLNSTQQAASTRQAQATKARNTANAYCPTITSLSQLNRLPKGRILTFVDLSPRLIVITHHDAVTGPYHRNADAILDVHHFFDGDDKNARNIVDKRAIDYVMICPNMNESTLYQARSPNGFYMVLSQNKAPEWLEPVMLPKSSPYMVWRVKKSPMPGSSVSDRQ